MRYVTNPKNGDQLSALAFGCMRLPGDEKLAERLIARAIEAGVNYFDTAYIYPGNEALMGRILSQEGRRDKVRLATKLPHYLVKKTADIGRIFSAQLERLRTDRIDYYLMHMLSDPADWRRLIGLGVLDWIAEERERGRIRNLGFSFHGRQQAFIELVDAYDWDFCMIQYNYLDENGQAGVAGLKHAAAKGMPVMIMEPLRGGKLATGLPKEAKELFARADASRSPAEWALRWVWNHPEATTLLSGMNTEAILEENLRIASDALPGALTEAELKLFDQARQAVLGSIRVPCTACAYCMPCPQGVDIPMSFSCYNDIGIEGRMMSRVNYAIRAGSHNASKCTRCGKCEQHCPQGIAIRDQLAAAKKALEGFPYRPARFVIRKFMRMT